MYVHKDSSTKDKGTVNGVHEGTNMFEYSADVVLVVVVVVLATTG